MLSFIGWTCLYGFIGGLSTALFDIVVEVGDSETRSIGLLLSAFFWPFFGAIWVAIGLVQLAKSGFQVWKKNASPEA